MASKHSRKSRSYIVALTVALTGLAAQAQTMPAQASAGNAYDANRTSWIPYTHNGYIGLNVGRSNFGNTCGALALRCSDSDTSGHVYLGGYFNPYFGAEIGYLDMGDMARAGGTTQAYGGNLSLVARAPLSQSFSIYGKLGATYGRTRVSAAPGTGVVSGRESGWGPSYAVGLSWDLSSNWAAVLEYESNRFQFAGNTHDNVRATSLGLKYSF